MFNNYFSSQSVVDDNNKTLPPPKTISRGRLDIHEISPQLAKDVFDGLDVNKSCGPDLMNPRLLKEGSQILAEPYSLIFTSSLCSGKFPTQWKTVTLQHFIQKMIAQCRQIIDPFHFYSLEKCVHKQLYNYFNEHNLLTPFQPGFVPGDSTTFQLLHIYHTFCEAVDSGVVFCDIQGVRQGMA